MVGEKLLHKYTVLFYAMLLSPLLRGGGGGDTEHTWNYLSAHS